MARRLLLPFLAAVASADELSALVLYKKVTPTSGLAVGREFNVTLTLFNKGAGSAYHINVLDDNWKKEKFQVTASGNNFSIDFLNGGDSHVHEFTVKPIKKTTHRIRAAKMTFIDGEEGENTIMHYSNVLPDLRIAAESHQLEATLLKIGKLATLNIVQTKQGWMVAGGVLGALAAFQVYAIFSTVIKRRRHLRALEDVKRM